MQSKQRARGFTGAQSSRYQTLVKPLGLSARPQPQSLLARVTLRASAPAPRASRVVYSTKNRVRLTPCCRSTHDSPP